MKPHSGHSSRCSSPRSSVRQRGQYLHPASSPTTATIGLPRFVPATVHRALSACSCSRGSRARSSTRSRRRMEREEVPPGRAVVREGDDAERFYVILSGLFTVSQEDLGPRRVLRPGDYFGEVGAGDGRSADGLGAGAHAGGRRELRPRHLRRAAAPALRGGQLIRRRSGLLGHPSGSCARQACRCSGSPPLLLPSDRPAPPPSTRAVRTRRPRPASGTLLRANRAAAPSSNGRLGSLGPAAPGRGRRAERVRRAAARRAERGRHVDRRRSLRLAAA